MIGWLTRSKGESGPLATVLEVRRRAAGLSRSELARAVGLLPCQVRRIEEGRQAGSRLALALADALEVTGVSTLFTDDGRPVASDQVLEDEGEVVRLPHGWAASVTASAKDSQK